MHLGYMVAAAGGLYNFCRREAGFPNMPTGSPVNGDFRVTPASE
jgi:hypothetical protein